jgi:hypothetical protein
MYFAERPAFFILVVCMVFRGRRGVAYHPMKYAGYFVLILQPG